VIGFNPEEFGVNEKVAELFDVWRYMLLPILGGALAALLIWSSRRLFDILQQL
jgi:hypothetical protein